MYTITDEQEKEIQSWVAKLPDSIVKSQIINLWEEVYPTNRMTVEQLEKFLSFQNALPKEFQSYPQVVAQWLKNAPATEKREAAEGTPKAEQVAFKNMVAESHAHINAVKSVGDSGEQKQEILHTLNVEDKTLAGTKAVPKEAIDEPTYEEELLSEAAESKKTSGGKPAAQKAEEESIIARNKEVTTTKPPIKEKVVVVKQATKKAAPIKDTSKKVAPKKVASVKSSKPAAKITTAKSNKKGK